MAWREGARETSSVHPDEEQGEEQGEGQVGSEGMWCKGEFHSCELVRSYEER